ncbi:MAG: MotA/TolQ/ExbB proton channel family protein [Planctomycetota bacterium]|nr:MotA/TolQ/ExbB proton channel family protein [Planctomycetota bacterium]
MEENLGALAHLGDQSLFDQGGPVMYALLLVAVIATTYVIYCFITLRRRAVMSRSLVDIAENLGPGDDAGEALAVCRREGGPFAEILASVILSRHLPRAEADSIIEGAGRRSAHDLSRGTMALEVVSGISTLLGLLGTVTGMFNMMMGIRDSGVKEIGGISGGIGEALITTIAGLIIAIPSYVALVYFSRRVEDIVLMMEEHAYLLLARLRLGKDDAGGDEPEVAAGETEGAA